MSPRRFPTDGEATIVDRVGASLLIRTGSDPAGALTAMARALRPQPGWTYVVSSPSVTSRPDSFTVLARVMSDWVVDPDVEVCLVILGNAREASNVDSEWRSLAERAGRPILAPLGPVTVGSDGTVAAAAGSAARGGWATYPPGGPPRYRPAWIPLPAWAKSLAPEVARLAVRGAVTAHPVPAGYWVLPRDEVPGRAGAAAAVAPEPTIMTVFVGGSAAAPIPSDDVIEALAAIPMAEHCRVVLLPRALPPYGFAQVQAWCGSAVAVQAAVPVWSDSFPLAGSAGVAGSAAWSLAPVMPSGQLAPVSRAGPTWLGADPPRPRRTSSVPTPIRRHRRRRWRARTEPAPLPGRATPAGWSLLSEARPIGVVRAAAGRVIEVDATEAGFVLSGKPVAVDTLAGLVAAACPPEAGPVIVVAHGAGSVPPGRQAFAQLADHLGRDLIAADADVSMSPFGVLYTAGTFQLWPAGVGAEGTPSTRVRPLGDVLPGRPNGQAPRSDDPPRRDDPRTGDTAGDPRSVLVGGRHLESPLPRRPIRAAVSDPATYSRPTGGAAKNLPASSLVAVRLIAATGDEDDRQRLRQVLDGRYDSHAQAVTSILADEPDVSRMLTAAEAVVGLVAVHSYCAGDRDTVNEVLRGEVGSERGDPATVIASCALQGLGQLPVVFGPVYAATRSMVPADAYEAGLVLIEPAFVDVDLRPVARSGPGIDYAIWSVGARRLGRLGAPATSGGSTAVFPPGTRFLVLGTDVHHERPRVLLLSLSAAREDSEWDDDIDEDATGGLTLPEVVQRLRATAGAPRDDGRGDIDLRFPIGLDPLGGRYGVT